MMLAVDDQPAEFARVFAESPESLAGTLRFFGQWFGVPLDNVHVVSSVSADRRDLLIRFEGSEVLRVTDPSGFELRLRPEASTSLVPPLLAILRAARVRWEFPKYGPQEGLRRRFYLDYRFGQGKVKVTTSINWFRVARSVDPTAPAVELY